MKRALFKIGNWFRIESTDKDCRFVVEVDVDKWKRDPDPEWHFQFTDGPTYKKYSVGKTGTVIEVRTLHDEVANSFELETFESALRREMQAAHQDAMNNGLVIELNGIALEVRPTQLLRSDDLRPARKQLSFSNGMPVNVDLFAGIAVSEPDLAGWYVICNGRMVLEADQSRVTGWGERKQTTIPKFHNQFARFRGYAYFDSDNAALLPWNTTKTGVDIDSPHFRAVRQEMLTLTRPVIDFLNQLDAEQAADKQPLDHLVKEAQAVNLTELEPSDKFIWPKHKKPRKGPQLQKIQYERPLEQVKKVMEELNASTFKEVGEKTFEYFYDLECE